MRPSERYSVFPYTIQLWLRIANEYHNFLNYLCVDLLCSFKFGKVLSGINKTIPVLLNVLWRPAHFGDGNSDFFSRNHFNRVPRANLEVIGIRFFTWDVYTNLTTNTSFNIYFTPALEVMELVVLLHFKNAINRADFETALAAGAVSALITASSFGSFFLGPCFAI